MRSQGREIGALSMIFVGVDPGLHGAVAWIDGERKLVEMRDCPLGPGGKYDKAAMSRLIGEIVRVDRATVPVVVLEGNHPIPRAFGNEAGGFVRGGVASFELGRGGGIWEGILAAFGLDPQMPRPSDWKREILGWCPKGKLASVEQAKRLFPDARICSQLYGPRGGIIDGRAEALLLAELGRRKWRLTGKSREIA